MKQVKVRFFLLFILFGISTLTAKIESNKANPLRKPTVKQLYGCYKIALGGSMVMQSVCSLLPSFYNNSGNLTNLIYENVPNMLEAIFGAHLFYFGLFEALKKPSRSKCLKIQYELCDSIALRRGIKSGFQGLFFLKSKAGAVFSWYKKYKFINSSIANCNSILLHSK